MVFHLLKLSCIKSFLQDNSLSKETLKRKHNRQQRRKRIICEVKCQLQADNRNYNFVSNTNKGNIELRYNANFHFPNESHKPVLTEPEVCRETCSSRRLELVLIPADSRVFPKIRELRAAPPSATAHTFCAFRDGSRNYHFLRTAMRLCSL